MSTVARELDYRTPQENGTPQLDFPFEMNGDSTSLIITRHYKQTYAGWLADRLANRYPLGCTVDSETGAYLIATSKPVLTPTSLQAFDRTFARIPLPQTTPSSLMLTKPVLPLQATDQVVGSYYLNRPDSALESYDAYFVQTVTADSGVPTLYPTGGTYDLGFLADTATGIAYNASASAIATALNALTSVTTFGGVTVTGTYNSTTGIIVTFGSVPAGSMNTGSLTATSGATVFGTVYESNFGMAKNFVTVAQQGQPDASVTPSSLAIVTSQTNAGDFRVLVTTAGGAGGTITITVWGQTTASITIPAGAPNNPWIATVTANIQAALNALTNVISRGSYAVSYGTGGGIYSEVFFCTLTRPVTTGGTFTVTVLSQTTGNIAYNASLATIATAINALSNVAAVGGVAVTGTNAQNFTVTLNPVPLLTANTASLTVAPASITITTPSSVGRAQTLIYAAAPPARILSVPAHGITQPTDLIFLKDTTTYYGAIAGGTAVGTFTVLDANTIRLNSGATASFLAATTIAQIGKRTKAHYKPGTANVRCLKVTTFYLPGVSAGVSSFDTIPLPVNQSDSATFLQAVFAGTGTVNWQVGELTQWLNSPILQQTTTTLDVADI